MNFITHLPSPSGRVSKHDGPVEQHLTEGAVMLAMSEWLFGQGASEVRVHPDGTHMAGFDMPAFLSSRGFVRTSATGKREISWVFKRGDQTLTVHARSGLGDLVTTIGGATVEVEAKGGCINTKHAGQLSRLRKGLHEAVGQLLGCPRTVDRLIAAVPLHPETEKLATRLLPRCRHIGIEIALVDGSGAVHLRA
ncbi:hypothetical protein [Amaricoccus sp. W119]|uniref:hypothetical protein n=1 Tax=Amaricoccus sp. W119 TaxID=3391833 RepID=UPI0039A4594A